MPHTDDERGHPCKTWLQTYDSPEFDESTRQAVQILEQELDRAPAEEAARLRAAFEQACVYELHFWASAHALQDWDASGFVPQLNPSDRGANGVLSREV